MKKETEKIQIAIYQILGEEGKIRVRIEDENVWLTQKFIAELFDVSVPTVNEHLKNIFNEVELKEDSVIRNFRITAIDLLGPPRPKWLCTQNILSYKVCR